MADKSFKIVTGDNLFDPVVLIARTTTDTPENAVGNLKTMVEERGATGRMTQLADGYYSLCIVPTDGSGDYIDLYIDLKCIRVEHVETTETEEV